MLRRAPRERGVGVRSSFDSTSRSARRVWGKRVSPSIELAARLHGMEL